MYKRQVQHSLIILGITTNNQSPPISRFTLAFRPVSYTHLDVYKRQGEDFQMFERDLPGENKAGFSAGQGISELPLETCETMNILMAYLLRQAGSP